MPNEQTHPTQETISNEETIKEVSKDVNAEQTKPEENGSAPGQTKPEQVDFSQMYDMLTERDNTIKSLKSEISELKKTNTNLLLKVNATPSGDSVNKNPYESFVDLMEKR